MSLAVGSRLAHYQILSPLGSGGMGEVYRAQDTRLDREVAIKVLPESFATDADRVARFEREARTLGGLNHPNVATLHGLEHVDGTLALVMELVPGETLAERIERGRIPVDEALSMARQIAEALDAAHDHGIVHRDLKPANVKVRDDGTVKVLDFGLAKAVERPESSGAPGSAGVSLMNSPTVTSPATAAGIILGTASYMSPEQARGRVVDKRTDIWAFGCVLFELLSARRAFPGSDVAEVIGATIHKEPDWQALPVSTPPAVRATLERCLQKDPRQRARDIADVRLALEGGFAGASAPAAQRASFSRGPALVLAALVGAIAAGLAVWIAGRSPAAVPPPETRVQIAAPDGFRYANFFSIAPNGRYLVFLATDPQTTAYRFWVHSFDTGESRQLTSAGITNSSQFWSPDSRFFAFAQAGELKRTRIEGGPPEVICSIKGSFLGGAWGPDNTILFATTASAIMRVSASGGTPTAVTTLAASREETAHSNPWFLPDGRHFIYLRQSARGDQSGIYAGSIDEAPGADPGPRLVATSVAAVFARASDAAPDRLLFTRDGALMVQPFDLLALRLTGEARVVADRVGIAPASYAHVWASETGTLVYRRSDLMPGGAPLFVNRAGQPQGSIDGIGSRPVEYPRVSPDGKRVVMAVEGELWSFDLTGRPPVKLTNLGAPQASAAYSPLWSLDGQRVVFEPPGSNGLLSVPADGSTTAAQRIGPVGHYHPHGWLDDRELLAVRLDQSPRGWGMVRLPIQTDGAATEVLDTTSNEGYSGAMLSPDGRWLAYTTNATGNLEVWIRRLAEPASPIRVSARGGTEPTWSQAGRELIYLEGDKFMRVPVTITGDAISVGRPEQLFETAIVHAPQPPSYDLMPDGRILLLKPLLVRPQPIEVILNWGGGR